MLFPLAVDEQDVPKISGLSYRRSFLDEIEEKALAAAVDAGEWDATWERRRQLYGASYGPGKPTAVRPIPAWGAALIARFQRQGITEQPFDQMLVNEYLPGQGIAAHRDYEPFDRTVASLSLLSPCVMYFQCVSDGRRESLLLERRSLLVLSDEARYEWTHGIARRRTDVWQRIRFARRRRLSITFRRRKH